MSDELPPELGPLAAWGLDVATARVLDAMDGRPGRVRRVDRGWVDVVTLDGPLRAQLHPKADFTVVVGDWVVTDDAEAPVVQAAAPRRGALVRTDPSGGQQVLAANVDVVVAVVSAQRPLRPGWIERAVAISAEAGAEPVIAISKADLHEAADDLAAIVRARAPGRQVLVTSAVSGAGVEAVSALAHDRTLALLGESGAGKSTLVNVLVGSAIARTGDVRESDSKGRHTTTHRELVGLPGGGVVLDAPGIRELGVATARDGITAAFPDVEDATTTCEWPGCTHRGEQGCGIEVAVANGSLDAERVERWRALLAEAAEAADRREEMTRREAGGRPAARRRGGGRSRRR